MRNPFRRRGGGVEKRELTDSYFAPPSPGIAYPDPISVDRAMRLGPVFAAGRLLASSIASMPLQQYRRTGDERRRVDLAEWMANPTASGTRFDWTFRCVTSMVYRGNGTGLVLERDSRERIRRVEWANPDDMGVDDGRNLVGHRSFTDPVWTFRGAEIPSYDVVHIPWFTMPGQVWGLSPLGAYAASVDTAMNAQRFSSDWFGSGGVPPGTYQNTKETVDQKTSQQVKQRLMAAIKSREPIVYGADWVYTPITVRPDEAQFVEVMRLSASQIAHIYGIPPEMIGGETGRSNTYQNVEQQSINFVTFTLLPWLTKLEAAFSALLPKNEYVKFNVDALIRPDASTRYQTYKIAREIGKNSMDEIRALEDEPPLPDGQGKDYTPLVTKSSAPQSKDEDNGGSQQTD